MRCVWGILYNATLAVLLLGVRIVTPFFPKLRLRGQILRQQKAKLESLATADERPTIWFHAASMGELEQIKPLVRLYRERLPSSRILVSVFSPSAYRQHRDLPCDALLLLPYDTPVAARRWVKVLQPTIAIVSRYDLWWNITRQLHKRGIPLAIVNATFPSTRWAPMLAGYYHLLYGHAKLIIARSERHAAAFQHLGIQSKIVVTPDTRIDQVATLAHAVTEPPAFLDHQAFRLLLGSTWQADETLWLAAWQRLEPASKRSMQLIIVPHEPTPHHCMHLQRELPGAVLLSQFNAPEHPAVVIVDRVGMLARLYYHASAAYIGGGFGAGVHSLLEAAFAGIPLSCGPRIERSDDAQEFSEAGLLRVLTSPSEAIAWLDEVRNAPALRECARSVQEQLHSLQGVSVHVYRLIEQERELLT